MSVLPLAAAARELGESPRTLRTWIRHGCPTVSKGRRGRGCATTVDVDAVRAWRAADRGDALILDLATELPEVLADAVTESFRLSSGIPKRMLGPVMCATWFACATKLTDRLRERCAAVPNITALPASIEQIRKSTDIA